MEDYNDEFVELFNRLDALLRDYYHIDNRTTSCVKRYEDQLKHSSFEDVRERGFTLESIRNIRNTFVHEAKINAQDAFYISKEVISFLENEIQILLNPTLAKDIMIPLKDIYYVNENSKVHDVIHYMSTHYISHAPILENGIVKGVFSESTLYTFLLKHENVSISFETRIRDFYPYYSLNEHTSERYMFVKSDLPIIDLRESFVKRRGEKRLAMIFLTEHGKENEPLEGLLTASNFLKNE